MAVVFLENLRSELEACRPMIKELHDVYDIENAAEKIEELHEKAAEPGFWDDPEKSQVVLQQTRNLEGKVERYNKFNGAADDIEVMIEMAAEEDEDTQAELVEEIKAELDKLKADLDAASLETLLTGEYDHSNAILNFHAGAGGTEAQDWTEMLIRMYTKWADSHGFRDFQPVVDEAMDLIKELLDVHRGRKRLRISEKRIRHTQTCPHFAF